MIFTQINQVPLFCYGLIMADPPRRFTHWSAKGIGKGADAQYQTMTIAQIAALPVADLAARDCVLWLWATNPLLPRAFDVLQAWGFQFKTAGHWSKKTAAGKQAFGTGYILRGAGEPFLIGTMGKPRTSRSVRSVIEGPAREHSRKPDEAFAAAEQLVPGVERLELFSREERPGWDSFGDEVQKFAPRDTLPAPTEGEPWRKFRFTTSRRAEAS